MIFHSVAYLVFFPAVVILYFILPQKVRNYWLLAASFVFYMNWNAAYGLLLLASILITYGAALLMEKAESRNVRLALMWGGLILNLGMLIWFKYTGFLIHNLNALKLFGSPIPVPDILLPVGISFFVFQALGYMLDVYRGKVKAEHHLGKYALFVSFFPQLVAGPIERSTNLLPQFDEKHEFDTDRVREGLLMMLWGLFMKIVIADRLAVIVDRIFEGYLEYTGAELFLAVLLFTVQIYCDFGGYSYIAIGSARVLGFKLMDNFRYPYLSRSIHEFWKRWHISLTGWFTDYLYIPLGGNRGGKLKKYRNTLIVFLISGLWHGANWTYVLWGFINGIYMVAEEALEPVRSRVLSFFKADRDRFSYRFFAGIGTFLLVSFSFLFFRAASLGEAVGILRQMKARPGFLNLLDESWSRLAEAGQMEYHEGVALLLAVILLLVVDLFLSKKKDIPKWFFAQGKPFRWLVYLGLLFWIILFGVYGHEYTQTAFIYFQF
ncbi:MAG: MBOAT family protein [Lachnospiraceae bacterium]|nr:MBOAT family protein [Lachnospiraceae bacterium]